jgi:hypothetical protein
MSSLAGKTWQPFSKLRENISDNSMWSEDMKASQIVIDHIPSKNQFVHGKLYDVYVNDEQNY